MAIPSFELLKPKLLRVILASPHSPAHMHASCSAAGPSLREHAYFLSVTTSVTLTLASHCPFLLVIVPAAQQVSLLCARLPSVSSQLCCQREFF